MRPTLLVMLAILLAASQAVTRSQSGTAQRSAVDPMAAHARHQYGSARPVLQFVPVLAGAHRGRRQALAIDAQLRAAVRRFQPKSELGVQLMNSLVSSKLWRIDPSSGSGVKHETTGVSDADTAARIAGRRFQMMRLAATWPSGMSL